MGFEHDDDSSWDQISGTGDGLDERGWDVISTVSDVESVASFFPGSYRDALLKEGYRPTSSIEETLQEKAGRGRGLIPSTKQHSLAQSHPGRTSDFATLTTITEYDETEKPMVSKLRRKHEKSGRRKCLRGHTGRFNLTSRGQIEEHSEAKLEAVHSSGANCDKEDHLTALEIGLNKKGRDVKWNLNKGQAWDLVPSILKEEAFEQKDQGRHPSASRSGSDYRTISTFKLMILSTETIVKGKDEAAFERDAERRQCTIYVKPPCRPWMTSTNIQPKHIFAELTKDTPEGVEGELLPWTLSHTNRRISGRTLGRKQTPDLHGDFGLFIEDTPVLKGK